MTEFWNFVFVQINLSKTQMNGSPESFFWKSASSKFVCYSISGSNLLFTKLLFFDFLPRWHDHFMLVLFEIVASYALKFM
jgi:hypothetical protein